MFGFFAIATIETSSLSLAIGCLTGKFYERKMISKQAKANQCHSKSERGILFRASCTATPDLVVQDPHLATKDKVVQTVSAAVAAEKTFGLI